MPVSKSQIRAARLLSVSCDAVNDEYNDLASRLDSIHVSPDGIPAGETWRTASKMTDAALIAALTARIGNYETLRSAYGE